MTLCGSVNLPPYTEGKERPKNEAGRSRLGCNTQGSLPARLGCRSRKRSGSLPPLPGILNFYTGLNWIQLTPIKAVLPEQGLKRDWRVESTSQRQGEGEEPPIARGQLTGQLEVMPSQ